MTEECLNCQDSGVKAEEVSAKLPHLLLQDEVVNAA